MLLEESQTEPVVETGAEILIDALADNGVDSLFGYPGGAVLPLYDALYTKSFNNILAATSRERSTPQKVMPRQPAKPEWSALQVVPEPEMSSPGLPTR